MANGRNAYHARKTEINCLMFAAISSDGSMVCCGGKAMVTGAFRGLWRGLLVYWNMMKSVGATGRVFWRIRVTDVYFSPGPLSFSSIKTLDLPSDAVE